MKEPEELSGHDSLNIISRMIEKAKASHHDNGTNSILWGVVITICSLVTWARIRYGLKLPFDIWLLAMLAIIPTVILSIRESKQRRVKTYDQTAMDYVWFCYGIAIFITIYISNSAFSQYQKLGSQIAASGLQINVPNFSELTSSYLLLLYGIPTLVTAGIKRFTPMYVGGVVCWISAIVAVHTNRETDMLLMALSAITAWLIPGLILRNRTMRLKNRNV